MELDIWRDSDTTYLFHPNTGYYERKEITEEDKNLSVRTVGGVLEWALAVVDGLGDTCDHWGHVLGEYRIHKVAPDGCKVYRIRGGQTYLFQERLVLNSSC